MKRIHWTALAGVLALALAPIARAEEKKEEKPAAPATAKPADAAAAKPADAAPVAPANAPKIEFEKDTVDLGDLIKGEKAQFTFNFKNTGKSDLEIREAKPSCGCTVADFTKSVKPGESGRVVATVDTSRFKGPITKTVTVTSNDPINATVHLQAKGNVKALVDVSPSENVYMRVFRNDDQPTKRVITITADAANAFEISKVESSNPAVSTNLINLNKADAAPAKAEAKAGEEAKPGEAAKADTKGANYQIEVDVKKDAPIGPLNGVITVTTTHKRVPTVTLNVSGQVLGEVMVTPQKVFLGQVTKETATSIKRTLRVERRSGTGFKIEKVESSNPAIKAEITPVTDGQVYTLTVSVTSDLPAGAINAVITIKTNDKDQPSVEVPVNGTVQG